MEVSYEAGLQYTQWADRKIEGLTALFLFSPVGVRIKIVQIEMRYLHWLVYNNRIEEDLTMSRKSKQHDKQFKLDALKYVQEHPDITQEECCKNLGISLSLSAECDRLPATRWKRMNKISMMAYKA